MPHEFAKNSNLATTTTRAVGFVPTVLHRVYLSPLGPLLRSVEEALKEPFTLLFKVNRGGKGQPRSGTPGNVARRNVP